MTDFADLILDNPRKHSEDVAGIVGIMKSPRASNALFKEEHYMPSLSASSDTATTGDVVSRLKMLRSSKNHQDAFEEATHSVKRDATLLMQLRVSVTAATAGTKWYHRHELTTSISKGAGDRGGGFRGRKGAPPLLLESSGAPKTFEKTKSTLDSARAWDAMSRRCQADLKA